MSGSVDQKSAVTLSPTVAADFKAWGVDTSAVEASRTEPAAFKVWADNWNAMLAFLACETQWRIAATMTRVDRIGLDYAAVDVVLRRLGFGDPEFADLLAMERAALEAFEECNS
ncbi:DUF1799 domain-containing protein [uncultured Tateyamaria sp.]|uniref:DUF1799 domain-containing protein n=1 Tax=uncultured Tateyamaria sp. TaxID=455651 RepID=UPI002610E6A0|nr:DUF1799 domain-containing protein [uncultured Tateyamaria sp.]